MWLLFMIMFVLGFKVFLLAMFLIWNALFFCSCMAGSFLSFRSEFHCHLPKGFLDHLIKITLVPNFSYPTLMICIALVFFSYIFNFLFSCPSLFSFCHTSNENVNSIIEQLSLPCLLLYISPVFRRCLTYRHTVYLFKKVSNFI